MTPGHIAGLVIVFAIALVPSALFIGVLGGRALHLPRMARLIATVAAALALAAGVVFFTGPAHDPADLGQKPPQTLTA